MLSAFSCTKKDAQIPLLGDAYKLDTQYIRTTHFYYQGRNFVSKYTDHTILDPGKFTFYSGYILNNITIYTKIYNKL